MAKTNSYRIESNPQLIDLLFGSKGDTGEDINIRIEQIVQILNSTQGKSSITYKLSENASFEGNFTVNSQKTIIVFNNVSREEVNLSALFLRMSQLQNIVIKILNPGDQNNFFVFKILSATQTSSNSSFEIALYKNFYSGDLSEDIVYSLSFDVKENFDDKTNTGGYTGSSQDLKNSIDQVNQKVDNLDTSDIIETTNKNFQTDAQKINNDATSPVQAQLIARLLSGGYNGTAMDLFTLINGAVTGITPVNGVTPSSSIPPTGNIFTIVTTAGTYVNWGSIVVPANTLAVLSRVSGSFSSSQTPLNLSSYSSKTEVAYLLRGNSEDVFVTGVAESVNGFYFSGNGNFTANAGFISKKFPIDPNNINYVDTTVNGAATAMAVYYTSAGVFISSQNTGVNGVNTKYSNFLLTVPPNAAFVGLTSPVAYGYGKVITNGNFNGVTRTEYNSFYDKINNSAQDNINIEGVAESSNGYYQWNTGTFITNASRFSKKFPINPNVPNYVTAKVNGSVNGLAAYYTSAGVFISGEKRGADGVTNTYVNELLTVPSNAAFVGITSIETHGILNIIDFAPTTETRTVEIVEQKITSEGIKPLKGKTIVWFGTSIPETGYPQIAGTLIGATVTNEAKGSSMCRRGKIDVTDGYGWTGLAWQNVGYALSHTIAEKNELINNWSTWRTLLGGTPPTTLSAPEQALFLDCSYENRLYRHLTSKGGVSKDIYVFDHGHNDNLSSDSDSQFTNVPANSRDRNTFIGSINSMIDEILKDNPRAKIVFIGHYENARKSRIAIAQETLAEYWDFPLLKLWSKLGWSQQIVNTTGYWVDQNNWVSSGGSPTNRTMTQIWMQDDLHPFSLASKTYIANHIAAFLNSDVKV